MGIELALAMGRMHYGGGLGGLLMLIGWIWLVVLGFQEGEKWWWGLLNLLIPIAAVIYGVLFWPKTKVPLILMIAGFLLGGGLSLGVLS